MSPKSHFRTGVFMNRQHRRLAASSVALLLSLCCAAALAQEAATLPATAPASGPATTAATTTAATQSATTESATQSATSPMSVSKRVEFNFKDASVDAVLNYLSESLGFIVIKDSRIEGRVTITSRQPVTAEEAVNLVNSVLQPLNYTAIQSGRVLRIMTKDKAKKNVPVHFGSDPATIKPTEEMITQVIPLGQVDAVKLRQDLATMFSPDADVVANASSNTLVITDTSANIRRLVEIISAMDKHLSATNDIKVFQLKYASASAAAKLITDVFKTDDANAQNAARRGGGGIFGMLGGFGRGGGGFGGPGGGAGGGLGGAGGGATNGDTTGPRGGKVTASSDDRTNTLVVTGPTETLQIIEQVVQKLDSNPTENTAFFIYHLKNANAANVQTVLNSFFGNSSSGTVTSNNRSATGFAALGASGGTTGLGGLTTGGGGRTTGTGGGNVTTGGMGGNRGGFGGGAGGTSGSSSTLNAINDLVGQAFVVADNDTNSLLVTVTSRYADRVKTMLMELDRDVPQVLIKVLIVEVTHSNSSDIGIEYSILNTRPSGNGQTVGTQFGLAQAVTNAMATGTPSGLVAKVIESNLSATLKALASTGKLDVLSRPTILGVDNQLASIMVGQSVPFVTASNITSVGTIVNSVNYQPIGIILNVTPHINPDGMVILDVAPQVSQISSQTVTIQAGVNAPVFDQRSAQCRVAVRNNQTIVIGGLMQDQKTETINKIPLLGDIPYLGALFSTKAQSKSKTELLFFLTPQVATNPDMMPGMSKEELNGTKIIPDAVGPGVFEDYMKRMRRPGLEAPGAATMPGSLIPGTQPAGSATPGAPLETSGNGQAK